MIGIKEKYWRVHKALHGLDVSPRSWVPLVPKPVDPEPSIEKASKVQVNDTYPSRKTYLQPSSLPTSTSWNGLKMGSLSSSFK